MMLGQQSFNIYLGWKEKSFAASCAIVARLSALALYRTGVWMRSSSLSLGGRAIVWHH